MSQVPSPFWSAPLADILLQLQTTEQGLTSAQAQQVHERLGGNRKKPKHKTSDLSLFLNQFKSPIILILIFAAVLATFLGDATDTVIILAIVLVSGLLGYWQERGASHAVEKLLAIVQIKAAILRDSQQQEIPVEDIVPGDVVVLNAGDVVPGDCRLQISKDLFVDEAALTGETYPVEKSVAVLPADTPLARRTNAVWMGTHVVSGTATAVVIAIGQDTEFGKVSERLNLRSAETEFEHGVRRFGFFLMEVTLILVIAIFAINVLLGRPALDSFLFSLALAVGLTPQLLPAIISINLAHGAKRMAEKKVIVKRLASIENFGSMNVLCSDKTGTLTQGIVQLQAALDADGDPSDKALLYAYLNAHYETGFTNPIDEAIRSYRQLDIAGYQKLDEVPYDFIRKRLSILVAKDGERVMIAKGALLNILEVCARVEQGDGTIVDLVTLRDRIQQRYAEFSYKGYRTLGIAYKNVSEPIIDKDHEVDMTFLGFLVLQDPPKPNIVETVSQLRQLGVALKIITGDNRLVATTVGEQMGLVNAQILTGPDLHSMSDAALRQQVAKVDLFAEVEPNHKERIISALRKAGNVVGYVGDGINDASALHAADVSISVNSAVDVAKEAADIVLLEQDLGVLVEGVREGRVTFANTLKYVFMATSANFGNMFSMAGASLFLPFLPLLPKQVLLTNLMTDFPEMTIATDSVDSEMVDRPRRWDIKFIRRFMITFGIVSSVFDFLTFGLLLILQATPDQFHTAWFMESVASASLIVLIVRTRRPVFESQPGKYLLAATLIVVAATILLPYTPLASPLGFVPLPIAFVIPIAIIVTLYMLTAETTKAQFYKRAKY